VSTLCATPRSVARNAASTSRALAALVKLLDLEAIEVNIFRGIVTR
jgi:hypothetical protein